MFAWMLAMWPIAGNEVSRSGPVSKDDFPFKGTGSRTSGST